MNIDTFIVPNEGSTDFAISPSGDRLLVGSSGGFLWLWNLPCVEVLPVKYIEVLQRCGERRLLGSHPKPVDQVTFLNSRARGASFSYDGLLSFWDLDTGNRRELHSPSRDIRISPDGRFVLASAPGGLYLWPLDSAQKQQTFAPLKGFPQAFSADAALLGYVQGLGFNILNLKTQERLQFKPHSKNIMAADFSQDGRFAATASQDHTVKLYDLSSQREVNLIGHTDLVRCVAFSPDGRWLASSGWDKTVRLWDLSDPSAPREARVLRGHDSYVRVVTFSPDSQSLASGGLDGKVIFWSLDGTPRTFKDSLGTIVALRFSPDQQSLVVGNTEGQLRLFSIDGQQEKLLEGHSYTINTLAFSPDGQSLASADTTQEIRLWDISMWRGPSEVFSRVLVGHTKLVGALVFTSKGALLSAGNDGSLLEWPDDLPRQPQALRSFLREAAAPFLEQ